MLEKCKVYIGADSGLGHVANAVKANTIILFSNDRPERCRPWGDKSVCIQGDKNDARNISVNGVSSAIEGFINE